MQDTDRDLLPEGLEDRLPQSAATAARVTRAVLDVMDARGYDRVQPPSIEFEKSLASRMAGVETRRMFRFVDPASLRTLALRSDITPQVGRIAATGLAASARPLRLCYAGQVLTIKGDGLDLARERLQIGAELIGSDSVAAVAEVVAMAIESLKAAGGKGISVDLVAPSLVRDAIDQVNLYIIKEKRSNIYEYIKPEFVNPIETPRDKFEKSRNDFDEFEKNIRIIESVLDDKDAGRLKLIGGEALMPLIEAVGPFKKAVSHLRNSLAANTDFAFFDKTLDRLEQLNDLLPSDVRVTFDPCDRHGFEYQSWFGFTLYAEGMRSALGRGGTYRIMGQNEPATGFSLYPDALIDALAQGETMRDTLFLPLGHDAEAAARLRAVGWRTVAALGESDDARALGCSHRLTDGDAVPVG